VGYDLFAAIIAGLIGTSVMTGMMLVGKQLRLPAIDVRGLLGYITHPDRPNSFGYIVHWALGAAFAIVYARLFRVISGDIRVLGAVFGIVHWLMVGWIFAFVPKIHAGMKAGLVKESGPYMLKALGMIGFVGGMVGHVVFGVTVALVYT
jgi:hypothetical protein